MLLSIGGDLARINPLNCLGVLISQSALSLESIPEISPVWLRKMMVLLLSSLEKDNNMLLDVKLSSTASYLLNPRAMKRQ